MAHPIHIKVAGRAVQQLHVVGELAVERLADESVQVGISQGHLGGGGRLGAAVAGEMDNLLLRAVIHALEVLAAADGPVHGIGVNAELVLNLLAQLEGVAGLAVHLVDEGKDGDIPHDADLEELAGLGLNTLGRVNDHDGAVRRHQGAVGILREVLMARGVQNVDTKALVLELHDRGRNRDAALLLDLHPVGGGGAGVLFALDHAGLGDGPAVEQKFFRQGSFTGVGMADNCECSAPGYFRFVLRHKANLQETGRGRH